MKIPVIKSKYKQPESIRAVLRESAEKFGDKIVYKYFNNKNEVAEMSFKQLYSNFNYIGASLCSLDLQGKKIALLADNRPEWIIAYMAQVVLWPTFYSYGIQVPSYLQYNPL